MMSWHDVMHSVISLSSFRFQRTVSPSNINDFRSDKNVLSIRICDFYIFIQFFIILPVPVRYTHYAEARRRHRFIYRYDEDQAQHQVFESVERRWLDCEAYNQLPTSWIASRTLRRVFGTTIGNNSTRSSEKFQREHFDGVMRFVHTMTS